MSQKNITTPDQEIWTPGMPRKLQTSCPGCRGRDAELLSLRNQLRGNTDAMTRTADRIEAKDAEIASLRSQVNGLNEQAETMGRRERSETLHAETVRGTMVIQSAALVLAWLSIILSLIAGWKGACIMGPASVALVVGRIIRNRSSAK